MQIIHRDIKPSNILFDSKGNAYLSDFGVAQVTLDSGTLTQTYGKGYIVGTPIPTCLLSKNNLGRM